MRLADFLYHEEAGSAAVGDAPVTQDEEDAMMDPTRTPPTPAPPMVTPPRLDYVALACLMADRTTGRCPACGSLTCWRTREMVP